MGAARFCCAIILAILLPPLGVFLHTGKCGFQTCLNIILTILGYVPGIIHALIVICCTPSYHEHEVVVVTQPAYAYPPGAYQQPQTVIAV